MAMSIPYPVQLNFRADRHITRWRPLVQWLVAIPHYLVVVALAVAGVFAFIGGFFAVPFTAEYPEGIRDFLVGIQRSALRVEAHVGLLADEYPPFRMAA